MTVLVIIAVIVFFGCVLTYMAMAGKLRHAASELQAKETQVDESKQMAQKLEKSKLDYRGCPGSGPQPRVFGLQPGLRAHAPEADRSPGKLREPQGQRRASAAGGHGRGVDQETFLRSGCGKGRCGQRFPGQDLRREKGRIRQAL